MTDVTASDLIDYFESSANLLIKDWETNEDQELDAEPPKLPENYSTVFQQCIKYADPNMGDYLGVLGYVVDTVPPGVVRTVH